MTSLYIVGALQTPADRRSALTHLDCDTSRSHSSWSLTPVKGPKQGSRGGHWCGFLRMSEQNWQVFASGSWRQPSPWGFQGLLWKDLGLYGSPQFRKMMRERGPAGGQKGMGGESGQDKGRDATTSGGTRTTERPL